MADLASVDASVEALERNVEKLRNGLQIWQKWDLEYEELKEEIQSLSDDSGTEELAALSTSFDGELLDAKAIREIFGLDKPPLRTPSKALRLLEQRQDYVQRNVATLSNQLAKAEFDLADTAPLDLSVPHDVSIEPAEHLPIYEIVENLDEDGKVIDGSMYRPDSAQDKIKDLLDKAGVEMDGSRLKASPKMVKNKTSQPEDAKLNVSAPTTLSVDRSDTPAETPAPTRSDTIYDETQHPPQTPAKMATPTQDDKAVDDISSPPTTQRSARPETVRKKSVSFAEDTKPPSEASRSSSVASNRSENRSVSFSETVEFQPAEEPRVSFSSVVKEIEANDDATTTKQRDLSSTFAPGSKVIELDDDDNEIDNVIIPDNETPEEAQLRRQMLAYNMNEVNNVVAELELEEGSSDDDDDFEYDSQFDSTDATTMSDIEDDDEHGRTKTRVVTDEYRRRMLELEKRLDAKMIANIGPNMPDDAPGPEPRDAHRIVVREMESDLAAESDTGSKKSVRFAEDLDVQERQPVMSDIVESNEFMGSSTGKTKKTSRSKAARQAAGTVAQASEHRPIMTENVMERPITETPSAPVDEAGDDDPEIRKRQLASEYYRLRNSIIRNQEGGFKESLEEAYEPLMEERDGKVRKVSRFRAAMVGGYKPDEE